MPANEPALGAGPLRQLGLHQLADLGHELFAVDLVLAQDVDEAVDDDRDHDRQDRHDRLGRGRVRGGAGGVTIANDLVVGGTINGSSDRNVKKNSEDQRVTLGLIICQRIIEAHNGKIWAESIEGQGSTFYFSIPVE